MPWGCLNVICATKSYSTGWTDKEMQEFAPHALCVTPSNLLNSSPIKSSDNCLILWIQIILRILEWQESVMRIVKRERSVLGVVEWQKSWLLIAERAYSRLEIMEGVEGVLTTWVNPILELD